MKRKLRKVYKALIDLDEWWPTARRWHRVTREAYLSYKRNGCPVKVEELPKEAKKGRA